jgi:hypothetical protein
MPDCHKALQPIDIIESPIQLNQCRLAQIKYLTQRREDKGEIMTEDAPQIAQITQKK